MLNLTADPKNEDPPSSDLSDISESDSESNSSQQTEIPDTKLAEVQNRSDNAASRNPSLPPSSMTSSIDDSEITIITPEAFVQNVQEKSEVLKDIVLDKTLPLSVRNHMKKALEAMEKSIVEPSSNQSQTPDAPNGCEDLPVNQGTAQPIQDDVQPNQVILRANQHKNSEPIEDVVQPNQQNVQSKQEKSSSTTSQPSKESTNSDAHLDGEPRPVSSNLRSHGPITKKYHNILKPIHQLYSHTIVYDGFKMALDSITQLYRIRTKQFLPAKTFSDTLSSRIQFHPVAGTLIKSWLKDLRRNGPDIFSPGPNEPFFRPDVWKFPSKGAKEPTEPEIGSELFHLFSMLCHPTEANQFKWASIFFQAVSLVAKDINSLPVYNNSTDPEDELGPEISMINYFIRCITSPNATSENATTSLEHKISFAALDNLLQDA
ncbi:hypothetical protein PCANC_21155 [Puccinia coronata f. sp. avenae]|uniref:Uncharacterized protein n=1 Tax=Puccinia coronata f. sp. avenae TaxID=200324 RepID=A0A2N5SSX6_9BASI|nr:hypothetical protein PCANC_21155 [Puccinia coronata f. sp. avenae]